MSIPSNEKIYTHKQGQYLAFIFYYTKINGCPPAQADFQAYFGVTSATVHQMIMQLEKKKLIQRQPNTPRAITVNIPSENIPMLI